MMQRKQVIKKISKKTKRVSISNRINENTQTRLNQISLSQVLECRICLQTSEQSQKLLIKPCSCSGSISYVHKCCLQTWIKQRINKANPKDQRKIIQRHSIDCQMCKKQIQFQFERKVKQITLTDIINKIKAKKCIGIFLISSFLAILGALIFIAHLIKNDGISFQNGNQLQSIVLIVSLVIISFFFGILLYLVFDQFLFAHEYVVTISSGGQNSIPIFYPISIKNKENNQIKINYQQNSNQTLMINSKAYNSKSTANDFYQRDQAIIIKQL